MEALLHIGRRSFEVPLVSGPSASSAMQPSIEDLASFERFDGHSRLGHAILVSGGCPTQCDGSAKQLRRCPLNYARFVHVCVPIRNGKFFPPK